MPRRAFRRMSVPAPRFDFAGSTLPAALLVTGGGPLRGFQSVPNLVEARGVLGLTS